MDRSMSLTNTILRKQLLTTHGRSEPALFRTPLHSRLEPQRLSLCPDAGATQPAHHFPPSRESVPSVSPCLLSINVFTWPGSPRLISSVPTSLRFLSQTQRFYRVSFLLTVCDCVYLFHFMQLW